VKVNQERSDLIDNAWNSAISAASEVVTKQIQMAGRAIVRERLEECYFAIKALKR
jgi:hypothetical protein